MKSYPSPLAQEHRITTPQLSRRRLHRWLLACAFILLAGCLIVRLYLAVWAKDYVNEQLNNIPGYQGSVEDIDIHLYRGAYVIRGLKIMKLNAGIPEPFISIESTDLSLQWGALFHGRVVSDIHMEKPVLNFAVSEGKKQTGSDTDWMAPIKKLMPIAINRVDMHDGTITFKNFSSHPKADLFITHLNGQLDDLRNVEDKNIPLPSSIAITGDSIGAGKLHLNGKLNVLSPDTDMDMNFALENANLTAFNSFSEAYGAIRFKNGRLDVYSEFVVKDAKIHGYVKPLVRNLSVDRLPKDSNPLEVAWATVASALLEVFINHSHDQVATKVPLEGDLKHVQTPFWPTIGGVLRNAFIEAIRKGTDNDVHFGGVPQKKAAQEKQNTDKW